MSSVPPMQPSATVIPFPGKLSSGKRADLSSGQGFDLLKFQTDFAERWMQFLRAQFSGPVAVAYHFGVTERAAAKWWDGIGGPRGDKVALALITVPGADALLAVPGAVRRAA
ncbi:hypothetical protein [Nostoc phage Nsp-JY21]